jgi:Fe-S cluster assembly ATP-binding protein
MSDPILVIKDLHAKVEDKPILRGVDLEIPKGEVHAIMGPNGSGKSTLAQVLMGHPSYEVTQGTITFKGQEITELPPDERARLGMFLAFQYPIEIPGVSVSNFLRTAVGAVRGAPVAPREFIAQLREDLDLVGLDQSFGRRNLNEGFSGGEKKRAEILQLALLKPELAILDETDSGLDIDGVRIVAEAVNRLKSPEIGFCIITHYTRILNFVSPDVVHILLGGRVVKSGGRELADHLEEVGYESVKKEFGYTSDDAEGDEEAQTA